MEASSHTAIPLENGLKQTEAMLTLGDAARAFFRHASPRIIATMVVAAWVGRILEGNWSASDGVVLGVLLLWWPFQEWLIHVFILHGRPRKILGFTLDPFVTRKHRRHHADPWNIPILLIPLRSTLISVPVLAVLFFSGLPTHALAWSALCFHLSLTLNYEWLHYLVHTRYVPNGRMYRHIWRNHRLHHCKNENFWFGVSMTVADRVLGTAPVPSRVETSDTCRSLGYS